LKILTLLKFNPLAFCALIIFVRLSLTNGMNLNESINIIATSYGKKLKASRISLDFVVDVKVKTKVKSVNNLIETEIPNIIPSTLNLKGKCVKVCRITMNTQTNNIGLIHSKNSDWIFNNNKTRITLKNKTLITSKSFRKTIKIEKIIKSINFIFGFINSSLRNFNP